MDHHTIDVEQNGFYVKVVRGSGTVRLREANSSELLARLPEHPDETHVKRNGEPTCVLPSAVARAVLIDMQLPDAPDRDVVYVRSAREAEGRVPFVHAVWYTPETADCITASARGAHEESTHELHKAWQAMGETRSSGSLNQPAAGVYHELGMGTLAGTGRTSLSIGGKGTHIPYPRNESLSDALEHKLSAFVSDVSEVLHVALPEGSRQDHEVDDRCPAEAIHCYQYPRLRPGVPPLSSHQVVIRGPRRGACRDDSDRQAYMSMSDLHVDPCDGGGSLGTVTVHTCHAHAQNATMAAAAESREHMRLRGLAVFPLRNGGRGVHINSMVPGWHCAIIMQTSERLHGSIQADKHLVRGLGLPDFRIMRVVTYPLKAVERLLQRLAEEPEAWPRLRANSHEWIQRRAVCPKM